MPKQITRKQFKLLIVAQFVAIILAVIAPFVIGPLTSEGTQALLEMYAELPFSTYNLVIGLLYLPLGLWSLQNMLALYQFKSYAPRHLFYLTIIGLISGLAFMPLDVTPYFGLEQMFYYIADALFGFTLAVVYFTNIAGEFKAHAISEAVTVPTTEPTV